jgi:hypothetical protein
MKKLVTLIAMVICITATAQTDQKVSYVSPKKDTLILPNDNIGELIAQTWDNQKKKPIIIFADQSVINKKNSTLQTVLRKTNKLQ